ncbi:MAG: serine hydroxymethyltransferase [Lentisphaerae bacterium RIFOXYB12_FULL_65_16]|nr:MAG: serine hydroxymethyltransferase [Lentisphaerae bacterium RIFOXYA12_64_32]OGV87615.1 MAG: serine hydroxymethyltransferase [Lentisphaerae bacterium RIFOXYB12_FULL_65_16]
MAPIRAVDAEIAGILDDEIRREDGGIELIASENFSSTAVRGANGSVMTNKYAEGYPAKRYYDGCEFVDAAEDLAIARACKLFGAEAANVQPHSGSQANMAVYFALLNLGDTVLGMSLDHGGHLTHGLKVNFSGSFYNFVGYGVDPKTEMLDYDTIASLARQHKPKMLLAGASAYPRRFDFPRLQAIAKEVGAVFVVDMAHIAGLVAAGEHPNPVPYADVVTTTTHKTLRGPRGGMVLGKADLMKKINAKVFPGIQGGPLMHVIAAKAVCLKEAMAPEFRQYQKQTVHNARCLAAALQSHGFRVVSGGTDNHLMLVDLRPKKTTGKVAAKALDKADITVNKNLIPFDPESPMVTSGLRIGTPAVTTRGMKEPEMQIIAEWISRVVDHIDDAAVAGQVRREIRELTQRFPLPQFQV